MIGVRHAGLPLLLLSVVMGCTRASPLGPAASDDDRSPYRRACASCHGADGRGAGPAAAALRQHPADLTLLAARNGGTFPREALVAVIVGRKPVPAHGTGDMPVWSIRFEPSSLATAVASIAAQRNVDAIVREVEDLQRPAP